MSIDKSPGLSDFSPLRKNTRDNTKDQMTSSMYKSSIN